MDPDQPNREPLPEDIKPTTGKTVEMVLKAFRSLQLEIRAQSMIKRIRHFSGEGSHCFHDWIRDVEIAGIVLQADDERYKTLVLQTLKGPAADFVAFLIKLDQTIKWPEIRQALFEQYTGINNAELATKKLHHLRQNDGESVQNFAMRIMMLAEDTYTGQDLNNPLIQAALIETLANGVQDNGVATTLIRENPIKFERAVAIAKQQTTRSFNTCCGQESIKVNTLNNKDGSSEFSHKLDKLVDSLDQLAKGNKSGKVAKNTGTRDGKSKFRWTEDDKPICNYCSQMGHTQNKCFSKKKAQK